MGGEVIELAAGRVEIEVRDGFLFIVEQGALRGIDELLLYTRRVEHLIARTGIKRGLIDARAEVGDAPKAVRDAMWTWLRNDDGRGFESIAFVLPTEMAVARVNMTALSMRASVRAFDSVFAAQRWLARGPRASTSTGRYAATSSRPPARRSSSPPPRPDGSYFSKETTEEHVRLPREDRRERESDFRRRSTRPDGSRDSVTRDTRRRSSDADATVRSDRGGGASPRGDTPPGGSSRGRSRRRDGEGGEGNGSAGVA